MDVKSAVTIVVSMDLRAMGRGYYLRGEGLLVHIMLYFGEATKQKGHLLEQIPYNKVQRCYIHDPTPMVNSVCYVANLVLVHHDQV